MILTTSLTQNKFRRSFLIFFSLASTLPLLIMILGIFQYVLPFLSSDQINGLRDTFTFGVLFMLLPPILGFGLMVRWIASFEAMVKEFKSKSIEITGKKGPQEEDELTVLHQTFNELFGELKHKMNQVNQYSKKMIDSNIKLTELANIDELTSMYNRRYFNLRLVEEVSRAERYNHDLSLVLIDLDKFKHYNDTLGHPAMAGPLGRAGPDRVRGGMRDATPDRCRADRTARHGTDLRRPGGGRPRNTAG